MKNQVLKTGSPVSGSYFVLPDLNNALTFPTYKKNKIFKYMNFSFEYIMRLRRLFSYSA